MAKNITQKEQHLHQIIDTFKEINHLLVHEKEISSLLNKTCQTLVHTRGYYFSWLGIFDHNNILTDIESFGDALGLDELKWNAKKGNLPQQYKRALLTSEFGVYATPQKDCPIKLNKDEWTWFIAPLKIDNKVKGIICAAVPNKFAQHPKEKQTFKDIADSIGFAIRNIRDTQNREKIQIAVQHSESKYRNLVNSLNDSLFIVQNGLIKYVTPSLCKISEYSEKELIDQDFSNFVDEAEVDKIRKAYSDRHSGKPREQNYQSVAKNKSGKRIPVEVSVINVEFEGKPALQVILHDISERQKTIQQLQESEERYRFLSESAFEGIMIHDQGIILDVNNTLLTLLGFTKEELIGKDFIGYLACQNENPESIKKIRQSFLQAHAQPYILPITTKNREEIYGEIEAKEISYNGKKVRIASLRNVSEEYRLEQRVNETRNKLNNLLNNLPGMAYTCIINETRNMEVMSPGCLELTGYSTADFLTNDKFAYGEIIHPADRQYVWDTIQQATNQNNTFEIEYRIITKSGQEKWVWERGHKSYLNNKMCLEGFISDVTQRKMATHAVQESEIKYRTLFNAINDAIVIHPFNQQGVSSFIEVNEKACQQYGYTREEMLQLNARDLSVQTQQNIAISKQNHQNLLSKSRITSEIEQKTKEGTIFPAEIKSQIFEIDAQKIIISVIRDISERKKQQEKITQLLQDFTTILDNDPTFIIYKDTKNNILRTTKTVTAITGLSKDEIEGHHSAKIYSTLADKYYQDDLKVIRSGEPVMNIIESLIDVEGNTKWLLTNKIPFKQNGKDVSSIIVFSTDITQLKRYETELLEKNKQLSIEKEKALEAGERYQTLFTNSGSAMFLLDTESGKITDANPAACSLYKYNYDELTALTINEINTLSEDEIRKEMNLAKKHKRNHFYFKHKLSDGSIKDVEVYSGTVSFAGKQQLYSIINDNTSRKEAEEKLYASEYLLNEILQSMPSGFMLIDEDYKIKRVNDQTCKITGYSKKELEGQYCDVICPKGKGSKDCPVWVNNNQSFTGMDTFVRCNGGQRNPILKNVQTIIIDGKKFILESFQDITQWKKAEQQLIEAKIRAEENQHKFEAFMNFMPGMAFIKDKAMNFMFVNRFMEKNLGAGNWVGQNSMEAVPHFIMDRAVIDDPKTFKQGRHKFEEHFPVIGRGTRDFLTHKFTIDLPNKEPLLGGISIDITERKKLEQKNTMLSKAIESSPLSVLITDKNGAIEYVNPFFEEKTGYIFNEIKGKNPRFLRSGKQKTSFYKNMWDTILAGNSWTGEFHNKKKSGELFLEKTTISPVYNKQEEIVQFIAIKEDVTQIKRTLKELETAKEKAEQSDRLKSSFLANMSHEIRTPMNGIMGFTDLLKEPDLTGEEQEEFIQIIQKSGERMLNTINDIIDISKIESGLVEVNSVQIDLVTFMTDTYLFFLPETKKKGIDLVFANANDTEKPSFTTDNEKLNSILTNLVKNAIKFTKHGSISFGYTLNTNGIELFVRDTGIGIPESRQKAVFERFVQADIADSRVFEGSGLGLAICKSYTEMLGGKIRLESEEGKGTSFYVSLPIEQQIALSEEELVTDSVQEKPVPGKLKILIAEDDVVSVQLLKILLRNIARDVLFAGNGKQAIEITKNTPDIDLILMDIKMPVMDGLEATSKIREFNTVVKIIAQTAFAQEVDAIKALEVGCDDFITKPINKKTLNKAIQNLWNKDSDF